MARKRKASFPDTLWVWHEEEYDSSDGYYLTAETTEDIDIDEKLKSKIVGVYKFESLKKVTRTITVTEGKA